MAMELSLARQDQSNLSTVTASGSGTVIIGSIVDESLNRDGNWLTTF